MKKKTTTWLNILVHNAKTLLKYCSSVLNNPRWCMLLSSLTLSSMWCFSRLDLLPSVPLEHFYHMVEADRVGALFSSHTCCCHCWLVQRCRCHRCANRVTRVWSGPNNSSSRLREDPCKLSVLQSQSTMSSHSTHLNIWPHPRNNPEG